MNKRLILKILGIILGIEGIFLLIPFAVALVCRENTAAFGVTALLCLAAGLPLGRMHTVKTRLQTRDGYMAVALSWLVMAVFGALPYSLSRVVPTYVDALFETVSGFTTTGSSVFATVETLPHSILLWRSLTQWLGGMGVLVMVLALLPKLSEGSVNLMRAESPGPISTKLLPRTADTAQMLYIIYIALTAAQTLLLRIVGLSWFDAVNIALTSISTGGFSVHDASIAFYGSSAVNWIVIFFMFISSVNFSLLYMLLTRRAKEALRSEELRAYAGIVLGAAGLIALDLVLRTGLDVYHAVEQAAFQVTTLISTTGFFTADYDLWPHFCRSILLLVMFIGGCAGSTAGGMKVSRIAVLFKVLRRELRRILHTREVRPITLDGQRVEDGTTSAVSAFFFAYVVILFLCTVVVSLDDVNLTTSLSAAITSVSNVGPALSLAGPTRNFAFFSPLSKLALSFTMLLGRLEIMPLLVLFLPSVWRKK